MIKNKGVNAILSLLKHKFGTKLIKLNLSDCGLTQKVFSTLFPVLSKNTFLKFLNLNKNNFTRNNFWIMRDSLRMNNALESLSMSNCKIDDSGAEALACVISAAVKLKTLIISHNAITVCGQ